MLRSLFGSKNPDRPTPPKNQIEVVCPSCGAAQYEPRLVVSTFCRGCGVHLTIQKRKVIASAVTRSGGAGVNDLWDQATSPSRPAPAAPPPAPPPEPVAPVETEPEIEAAAEETTPTAPEPLALDSIPDEIILPDEPPTATLSRSEAQRGFGEFLRGSSAPAPAPSPHTASPDGSDEDPAAADSHLVPLRRGRSHPPPPAAPSPAADLGPTTFERMKEQGMYRQQYFKDAVCFECEHHFKVGRSTKTTNCPQCGAAICMEDVEVNMNSTQPIQTRGDVIIRKRGHVSTSRIDCKDLRCYGIIEANVHCTGEALFKTEGTIIGEVRCKRLIIEKGASVEFANTVFAEEMEINASATGDLHSSGRILILPYGSVNGDVTARAVSIEPGGELNGGMHIIRQAPPSGPLPSMD